MEGGDEMIVYKDILKKLSGVGWSSYRLRNSKVLSETTMQRIRTGRPITTESIDRICGILHCPIDEIVEYVPDEGQGS